MTSRPQQVSPDEMALGLLPGSVEDLASISAICIDIADCSNTHASALAIVWIKSQREALY